LRNALRLIGVEQVIEQSAAKWTQVFNVERQRALGRAPRPTMQRARQVQAVADATAGVGEAGSGVGAVSSGTGGTGSIGAAAAVCKQRYAHRKIRTMVGWQSQRRGRLRPTYNDQCALVYAVFENSVMAMIRRSSQNDQLSM
jgi:hypothetical protein